MNRFVGIMGVASILAVLVVGCGFLQTREEDVQRAIIEYAESKGQEQACAYMDRLVAEGKLGAANAERLKTALADGIDKLKEELSKGVE